MTHAEFNQLVERRFSLAREVLIAKASEYADDAERLHNFKLGAQLTGSTPERVCSGYMLKHFTSVMEMATGDKPVTQELIDEKLGDLFNYVLLLEGTLTERLRSGAQGVPAE